MILVIYNSNKKIKVINDEMTGDRTKNFIKFALSEIIRYLNILDYD